MLGRILQTSPGKAEENRVLGSAIDSSAKAGDLTRGKSRADPASPRFLRSIRRAGALRFFLL
jgi:hypothetical protein